MRIVTPQFSDEIQAPEVARVARDGERRVQQGNAFTTTFMVDENRNCQPATGNRQPAAGD